MTTSLPLLLARTLSAALAFVATGFTCFGGYLIVEDLRVRGEYFDGFGLALGLMMAVPALPGLVLAMVVLFSSRATRNAAAGGLLALYLFALATSMGGDYAPYPQIGLVVGVVLALASAGVLLGSRPAGSKGSGQGAMADPR